MIDEEDRRRDDGGEKSESWIYRGVNFRYRGAPERHGPEGAKGAAAGRRARHPWALLVGILMVAIIVVLLYFLS